MADDKPETFMETLPNGDVVCVTEPLTAEEREALATYFDLKRKASCPT